MNRFHGWLTNANYHRIFNCVNYVLANDPAFRALGDKNHVIAFHETNEAEQAIGTDFL